VNSVLIKDSPVKKRIRLQPHDREKQILDAAIQFYSEVGMRGTTRELATRLGVTQGLIYRYFPDKEALITRVYEAVFVERWAPNWEESLKDRDQPLRRRFVKFYFNYARVIHTREWVRIFLLSGFEQHAIQGKYRLLLEKRLMPILVEEMRKHFNVTYQNKKISEGEIELIKSLQAMIFHLGVRKWIYCVPVPPDTEEQISIYVDMFLFGLKSLYKNDGMIEPI
jgi:AcrR family transcriptional regulator